MTQKRSSRVNMADVARESGVSLSTVSMVFSNKPGLPTETRQRILKTAHRLGYNPRRIQKVSPRGSLRTIGVVIKSQFNEPPRSDQFYSHIVAGIEAACRQNHINLMYAAINTDPNNYALEIPRLIENDAADGLLLLGARVDSNLEKILNQQRKPIVLVDSYSDCGEYDSVVSDNERGAYLATRHLIEMGHRKIGFIGGSANSFPSIEERRCGCLNALQDFQLSENYFADFYSHKEETTQATRTLLSQHPEITALVGANDFIAITAMHVANQIGRKVGDDLSIIGFDDILLSESVIPPLTTMQIDKVAMGKMAVQLLFNRIQVPKSGRITAVIHPQLIERNSVKRIQSEPLTTDTNHEDLIEP